jgi:four helix bundle protein
MSDFKKLRVWRTAHALTLNINRVAGAMRGTRYASLRNQIERAAMSVSANIVEGRQQKSEREFARFLGYALASTSELENHLIVAHDIRVVTESDYRSLLAQLADVRKMLHGLLTRLSKSPTSAVPSVPAKGDKRYQKRTVPTPAAESDQRSAGGG